MANLHTSKELLEALYVSVTPAPIRERGSRRYRQWWPGGAFLTEIEAPPHYLIGPRGGKKRLPDRRADAIWIPKGYNKIHGYEVKVSRADLRAELAQPDKCESWKRFCDTWDLVVPDASFIEGFDVPEDWGILALPSGRRTRSMTVLRKAPQLSPIDQGPAYNRCISALAWKLFQEQTKAAQVTDELRQSQRYISDMEEGMDEDDDE